jgi:hypothetical protein
MRRWISTAILVALAGLGFATMAQTDPKKLKDTLTGDAKGSAANNPQCKLFTPAEIAGYLGTTVGAGENAAGGSGCSWHDKDYEVLAYVNVIGPDYYVEMSGAKGFERLQGIGKKAWVAADSGWTAGALFDDSAFVVNLDSPKASKAAVVALLQEAVKRRRK